jgi:hypothetical protein
MGTLFSGRRARTPLASGRRARARRGLLVAVTAPLLVGLPACTASGPDLESVPADATVGAAPVAPPTPIETYADGRESAPASEEARSPDPEVVVTFVEWDAGDRSVDVGGYLSTIASDGRCTLRLLQGDRELVGEAEALPDATTTSCGAVRVDVPAGLAGAWQGVLEYDSAAVRAASEPFPVDLR